MKSVLAWLGLCIAVAGVSAGVTRYVSRYDKNLYEANIRKYSEFQAVYQIYKITSYQIKSTHYDFELGISGGKDDFYKRPSVLKKTGDLKTWMDKYLDHVPYFPDDPSEFGYSALGPKLDKEIKFYREAQNAAPIVIP